jgi:hypothetical protein
VTSGEEAEKEQIMSEKPRKLLVGWKQYIRSIGKKGLYYSFTFTFACVGAIVLAETFAILFCDLLARDWLPATGAAFSLCIVGLLSIWFAKAMFKYGEEVESVELITRHNTCHLPVADTLGRSSERPSTDQQAELLRAAGQGPETPAEELLRATNQENMT